MEGNIASLVYMGIIMSLIILFFVSFALFIRKSLINTSGERNRKSEIEKKLDKIIDLLGRRNS